MSRLAGQDEIKRSYRRLVARYHPDVNPAPDAHAILIEINEAYGVLSDPTLKWNYDSIIQYQAGDPIQHFVKQVVNNDPRKRRGRKETEEERIRKRIFAVQRNKVFNKKLKILSMLSFLLASLIFVDHYLPTSQSYVKAYAPFKQSRIVLHQEGYNIFLNNERKVNLIPYRINEEAVALLPGEALVYKTPVLGIISEIQVGKYIFKPLESLHDLMLIFGFVSLASMFVLSYKIEKSLVLPAILTFFCNIFVVAFFILWLTE